MKVKTLEELVNEGALEGKRVFIRADMNVPRDAEGNVTDDHRLKESMPAVKMAEGRRRRDGLLSPGSS